MTPEDGDLTNPAPDADPNADPNAAPNPDPNADAKGDPSPDPIKAAVDAGIEARLPELEAQAREKLMQEQRETARQQAHEEAGRTVQTSYDSTVKAITQALTAPFDIEVDDGQGGKRSTRVQLSEAQVKAAALDHIETFQKGARAALATAIYSELADFADEVLPNDEARAKFVEEANDKEPGDWLKAFAEVMSPHTKAYKAREDGFRANLAIEKARSFTEGKGSPLGQPNADGKPGTPVALEGKSAREIADMHLTDDQLTAEVKRLAAAGAGS